MAVEEPKVPAETSVTDPPQEEKPNSTEAPSKPEETVEKPAKKTDEPAAPEVNLDNFEVTDDGRIQVTVGNSKYYGKDVDEAWKNALKGIDDKDKAYQAAQAEIRKLKAESSIREPEDTVEELPPQPQVEEYIQKVFKERGLDPKHSAWGDSRDPRWAELQEQDQEHKLKDYQVTGLIQDVQNAKQEAMRRFYGDETRWLNLSLMRKEITPAVRDMVSDAGLDPDEFGDLYLEVLKQPESRYKNGELNQSVILRAINKKIVEKLKETRVESSELQKKKDLLKKELEEKKRLLSEGASWTVTRQQNPKEPKSIGEAFKRAETLFKG